MADAIIASTPVHGHLTPLLVIAEDLVRRGHRVSVLTGSRFEAAVKATGAAFTALPEAADYDDRNMHEAFPERASLPPGLELGTFDLKHIFGDPITGQYQALQQLLAQSPKATVITDNLFLGALPLALIDSPDRPRTIAIGISPPFGPGDFDPEDFVEGQQYLEKIYSSLGVALPGFIFESLMRVPDHYLQLTVPDFEYPRDDRPTGFQFIGALPQPGGLVERLPDWWPWLNGSRPVVVVTQGTFANVDLGQLIAPTVRALADSDVFVVAATGHDGGAESVRALLGTVPENVVLADYVPFDLLLPNVDVLVTNGGYGGVHAALRYGVPLVVAGATEDKPKVAARVAWSGTGINLHTDRPDETALRSAVNEVLHSSRYANRAGELRNQINSFDPLDSIAAIVEE